MSVLPLYVPDGEPSIQNLAKELNQHRRQRRHSFGIVRMVVKKKVPSELI
jgi:hypothetical protein